MESWLKLRLTHQSRHPPRSSLLFQRVLTPSTLSGVEPHVIKSYCPSSLPTEVTNQHPFPAAHPSQMCSLQHCQCRLMAHGRHPKGKGGMNRTCGASLKPQRCGESLCYPCGLNSLYIANPFYPGLLLFMHLSFPLQSHHLFGTFPICSFAETSTACHVANHANLTVYKAAVQERFSDINTLTP